jgi:hypothetical protein
MVDARRELRLAGRVALLHTEPLGVSRENERSMESEDEQRRAGTRQ